LEQQFELVFVQTFVVLTTEVMADIVVKFLTEQTVLSFQRDDTRTQLFNFFKQRSVGVHQLALIDTRRRKKVSWWRKIFQKTSTAIPVLFRAHFQPVDQRAELFTPQIYLTIFTDRPGESSLFQSLGTYP
jgi:hypothetical protein